MRTRSLYRTDAVDHAEFDAAADAALAAPESSRRALLEGAAAMWAGGPPPEDRADARTAGRPPASAYRYVAVLTALTQLCGREGDALGAIRWGRACLALDRLNEHAHREVMIAYARTGSVAAALAQYRACRHILAAELGAEPSLRTEAVHAWLRRGGALA